MKKLLFISLFLLLSIVTRAFTVVINGINYNLTSKLKTAEVVKKNPGYYGKIVIPETVFYEDIEYKVTSIADNAFYWVDVESVTIPNSVTSIGNQAFSNCYYLVEINIPNSVTSIGEAAFGGCTKLESLSLPNSVTNIGNRAFVACEKLTSFTIPNSITSISANCFERCYGLTSIEIPNSVTSIGESAFQGCTGLASIALPNSVINIREGAFSKCSKLTSINLPNSIETIGSYAFSECINLQSITIPNKVSTIDSYTFYGCKSLASIDIPNTVNAIKSGAFQNCVSLKTIIFPNSINTISSAICQGCEKLAEVTIPSSIQSIGNSAFSSCSELKDFYCFASIVPSTKLDVFNDSYIEYATLHIPSSSANAYKENAPWNCFGNIVTLENEEIIPSKCATPTINYREGKLIFYCETEGAEFITEINDDDIKKYYESEISLNATYNISVYAVKTGYINSDIVYATLCWIDLEPQTEGISNEVASIRAKAALIQNGNGIITIKGIKNGTNVGVYSLSGVQISSTISQNGSAILNTNAKPGSTVVVTIGKKSLKVLMR